MRTARNVRPKRATRDKAEERKRLILDAGQLRALLGIAPKVMQWEKAEGAAAEEMIVEATGSRAYRIAVRGRRHADNSFVGHLFTISC
jgi:hypothetical protein